MAEPQVSEQFCAADADLTISSSDGVLFKVHRKNLEVHSDIFADAGNATQSRTGGAEEVVQLSENAAVLDLMFQYMYRQLPPNLQNVDFKTFSALAEAVEKYMIYSALTPCRAKMEDWMPQHPLEVLEYASKHHLDIVDEAARQSMGLAVEQAMKLLSPDTFKRWILFYERWHRETLLYFSKSLARTESTLPLLRQCLADQNGCYTFRQQLQNHSPSALQKVMDMKFTAA